MLNVNAERGTLNAERGTRNWASAFCVMSFAFCVLSFRLCAESLAENQARFGPLSGDVGLLSLGAAEWIEPHEGLPIEVGDRIRTGEDGRAELAVSENALWVLDPETEVVIEHTEVHQGRLNLSSGTLLGRVDSDGSFRDKIHWEFKMPSAVVSIRGTEFVIVESRREGTRVGVLEGVVNIEPAETSEGLQPVRDVIAGQEAVVQRGKTLQILPQFTPRMKVFLSRRPAFKRQQEHIQNTWSPFTPTVRQEARRKFVEPPVRARPRRPKAAPRRPSAAKQKRTQSSY